MHGAWREEDSGGLIFGLWFHSILFDQRCDWFPPWHRNDIWRIQAWSWWFSVFVSKLLLTMTEPKEWISGFRWWVFLKRGISHHGASESRFFGVMVAEAPAAAYRLYTMFCNCAIFAIEIRVEMRESYMSRTEEVSTPASLMFRVASTLRA
jgi:hypothetical protein